VVAVDAEQVDQVRALHADGRGCNEIARTLGVSASRVSELCASLGLTFDREQTRQATAARQADLALRRAALQEQLLDKAAALLAELDQPHTIHAFGGRDNVHNSIDVATPPPRDKRDLVAAATSAIGASLRLADHDQDTGASDARSMLGDLARGLTAAYRELSSSEDGADADGDDPPAPVG
jgi:hypothetical protein